MNRDLAAKCCRWASVQYQTPLCNKRRVFKDCCMLIFCWTFYYCGLKVFNFSKFKTATKHASLLSTAIELKGDKSEQTGGQVKLNVHFTFTRLSIGEGEEGGNTRGLPYSILFRCYCILDIAMAIFSRWLQCL